MVIDTSSPSPNSMSLYHSDSQHFRNIFISFDVRRVDSGKWLPRLYYLGYELEKSVSLLLFLIRSLSLSPTLNQFLILKLNKAQFALKILKQEITLSNRTDIASLGQKQTCQD